MLNVLADTLALAAVRLMGIGEVSSIFYGHKHFWIETRVF